MSCPRQCPHCLDRPDQRRHRANGGSGFARSGLPKTAQRSFMGSGFLGNSCTAPGRLNRMATIKLDLTEAQKHRKPRIEIPGFCVNVLLPTDMAKCDQCRVNHYTISSHHWPYLSQLLLVQGISHLPEISKTVRRGQVAAASSGHRSASHRTPRAQAPARGNAVFPGNRNCSAQFWARGIFFDIPLDFVNGSRNDGRTGRKNSKIGANEPRDAAWPPSSRSQDPPAKRSEQMEKLAYSSKQPTKPGWYWCSTDEWEAVVHVFQEGPRLMVSWMTGPGEADVLAKEHWSEECRWAGPIEPPTNS